MKIASLAEVKAKLSAFVDEAEETGPIVITRNGRAVALLLAPDDEDDLERLLLSRSLNFQKMLARSRSSIRAGKGIPHDMFWKEIAAKPNPSRASSSRKPRAS